MKIGQPSYYDSFQCWAGDCPDTCCAAWDIVIDDASAAFYRSVPGELGERIRAAMTMDSDGDLCFAVSGGHCPLLTAERLCTIQLELGEERVCDTCRSHPRFTEEYGWFKEHSLAASCPAAMDLILREEFSIIRTEDEEEDFVCDDVDEGLLRALLPCREAAFALLGREELPWRTRLAGLLMLGSELQLALAGGDPEELAALGEEWKTVPAERLTVPPRDPHSPVGVRLVDLLGELEVLDESWRRDIETLDRGKAPLPAEEAQERRWACYLIWRWFLRADFDGDIYGKLALPVLSILTLRELSRGGGEWKEWARRWAKEVEHCEENRNDLSDAACLNGDFAPHKLIGAL